MSKLMKGLVLGIIVLAGITLFLGIRLAGKERQIDVLVDVLEQTQGVTVRYPYAVIRARDQILVQCRSAYDDESHCDARILRIDGSGKIFMHYKWQEDGLQKKYVTYFQ